ncbi:hypothetical protein JOD67_006935 [Tenggerimyces flavus]|nr:hypothetical protein [Tenggerimyces flavus]
MPACEACGNDYNKAFFVTTHDNVISPSTAWKASPT